VLADRDECSALEQVVDFKQNVYREVAGEFGPIIERMKESRQRST
jgi:hypothetical protein